MSSDLTSSSEFPDENLLLYLNLTGELFYIVAHRMRSQGIETNLQDAVFNQLVLGITTEEIIQQLMNGTLQISKSSFDIMKNIMKDIVDGTIMKMNDYSMEKLFELTLIATKYQFTVCSFSRDILLIVLNHLDTIRKYTTDPTALYQLESLHNMLVDSYSSQSTSFMSSFQNSILFYLHDMKLKMTNLVNLGLQDSNGDFIPLPEQYLLPGDYTETSIDSKQQPQQRRRMHSYELNGDRIITLGLSIYDQRKIKQCGTTKQSKKSSVDTDQGSHKSSPSAVTAVHGLELFSTLLAGGSPPQETTITSRNFEEDYKNSESKKTEITQNPMLTLQIDARNDRATTAEIVKIGLLFENTSSHDTACNAPAAAGRSTLVELMDNLAVEDD